MQRAGCPLCVCAGGAVCLEADKTSVRQRMSLSLRMNNSWFNLGRGGGRRVYTERTAKAKL